jgi:hypothetical protein
MLINYPISRPASRHDPHATAILDTLAIYVAGSEHATASIFFPSGRYFPFRPFK